MNAHSDTHSQIGGHPEAGIIGSLIAVLCSVQPCSTLESITSGVSYVIELSYTDATKAEFKSLITTLD
jgi:hypothetical protein